MNTDSFLDSLEREKIVIFNADVVLVNAVRKVLLEAIYNNGVLRKGMKPDPLRNAATGLAMVAVNGQDDTGRVVTISNEELGADLRAMTQGINLLEQGLAQLAKITSNKDEPEKETVNPGI